MKTKKEGLLICRCEEISKEEIIGAIRAGARSTAAVKRRTTAGMGLCQGRTCQRLIAQILKQEAGVPMEDVQPMTVRPPVRPIPMHAFLTEEENSWKK